MSIRLAAALGLFTAILAVPLFAVPADLVPAMAALDKVYIPALGITGQSGELARARTAFQSFEAAWNAFRERFAGQPGFDAAWAEDLAEVDAAVTAARTQLMDQANGPAAHEALEAVRGTLLASRARQQIPYFLDYLTLFHDSMEELLANTPAGGLAEWRETQKLGFAADLDAAIARWSELKAQEGLLPQAGLDALAASAYQAQHQLIRSLLERTRAAFAAGDPAFAGTLRQLKPSFVKTFFLFGDFPR